MNWKLVTLAFKDSDGAMSFVSFVAFVIDGDLFEMTYGFLCTTDEVGQDRAEIEGLKIIGCSVEDLNTEV